MIIVEFKKHFPPRAIEWLLAALMVSWGASVLLHPGLFEENPVWGYMKIMAPQAAWGMYAFCIGLFRAVALFINGAWYRTPQIRIGAAFACCFVWTQILLGLAHSQVDSVLTALIPWFILADIYASYRAGADASRAKTLKDMSESVG